MKCNCVKQKIRNDWNKLQTFFPHELCQSRGRQLQLKKKRFWAVLSKSRPFSDSFLPYPFYPFFCRLRLFSPSFYYIFILALYGSSKGIRNMGAKGRIKLNGSLPNGSQEDLPWKKGTREKKKQEKNFIGKIERIGRKSKTNRKRHERKCCLKIRSKTYREREKEKVSFCC